MQCSGSAVVHCNVVVYCHGPLTTTVKYCELPLPCTAPSAVHAVQFIGSTNEWYIGTLHYTTLHYTTQWKCWWWGWWCTALYCTLHTACRALHCAAQHALSCTLHTAHCHCQEGRPHQQHQHQQFPGIVAPAPESNRSSVVQCSAVSVQCSVMQCRTVSVQCSAFPGVQSVMVAALYGLHFSVRRCRTSVVVTQCPV